LLFDVIRLDQDVRRGGVHPVLAAATWVGERQIFPHAEAILESAAGAAIADADLAALEREVDALLASEPPFAGVLAGEAQNLGLHEMLPKLKPADWTPPGGWDAFDDPTSAEFA